MRNSLIQRFGAESTTEESKEIAGTNVTYAEGDNDGKQDLIVMSGPLSEVYTKALGVYFAKKDIIEEQDGGEVIAVETQANDAIMASKLATVVKDIESNTGVQNTFNQLANKINLVSQYDDFDETPDVQVIVVDQTQLSDPEVIESVNAASKQANANDREVVLFAATGDGAEVFTPNDEGGLVSNTEVQEERLATESLYQGNKFTLVYGMEGFANWMRNRYVY